MLADDRMFPADVFLLAAGIAPNIDLARAAGLQVNRGVLVDERMRTSDPHILAAGDVAEHAGRVHGLWPVAVEQAEVAADNAVGGDKAYVGSIPFTMLKVVGVELTSVGRFEEQAGDDVVAIEEPGGKYRKLVIEDGRIVGAILLGYSQEVAAVPHRDQPRVPRRGRHGLPARRPLGRPGRALGGAPAARGRPDGRGVR